MDKMNARIKNRRSAQRGFTLIELVVVLALMAIMLSVAFFGALGWIDWVRFQQEDETAEDIFFAAQNQLTELDSSGAMQRKVIDALWDSSTDNYKSDYIIAQGKDGIHMSYDNLSGFVKTNGEGYDWNEIWLDSNRERESRTILGITVAEKRYDLYLDANTRRTMDPAEVLLFDLIAPYVADKTVLNGSIAIEFSPEAGQVFAVCYSDQAKAFSYTQDTSSDTVNIKDRTLQVREDHMVGYYGVDVLTNKNRGRSLNKDEYWLELENGNAMVMTLHPKSISQQFSNASLTFVIQGSYNYGENKDSNYHDVMKMSFNSDSVPSSVNTIQKAGVSPTKVTVEFLEGIHSGTKTLQLPVWKETTGEICVALDAADIQAQSISYANMLELPGTDSSKKDTFENTYSFYRFGLTDVRFIRASVNVSMAGAPGYGVAGRKNFEELFEKYSDGDGKIHGEAVTFANWSVGDTNETYGITNGRHLYNIRFESDYSDELKKKKPTIQSRTRVFTLKNEIDWKKDFTGNGNSLENCFLDSFNSMGDESGINLDLTLSSQMPELAYWKNTKTGDTWSSTVAYPVDTSSMPFPGFRALSYSDQFIGIDSTGTGQSGSTVNQARLSNLNITLSGNCIYGVYGKDVQTRIKNHQYELISSDGKAGRLPLGLFAESYGKLQGIEIDHINVSGIEGYPIDDPNEFLFTSKVGGFVGENFGELKDLFIDVYEAPETGENAEPVTESHIRGRFDVGGIVGHQYKMVDHKDGDGNSTAPTATTEAPYADASVTISGCINHAKVTGIGYVGGIIGRIYPSGDGNKESKGKNAFDVYYDGVNYADNYFDVGASTAYSLKDIKQFVISECENYGEISMDSYYAENVIETNTLQRGFYYGGITGAAFFAYNIDGNDSTGFNFGQQSARRAVISGCTSVNKYSKDELYAIIDPKMTDQKQVRNAERLMRMNFVGGIVGGTRYATIEKCSTAPEYNASGSEYSFVFGDRYVGGIAGYSVETDFIGGQDYTTEEIEKLTGKAKGSQGSLGFRTDYSVINGTGVAGNYAIGGIAGAFGRPEAADGKDAVKEGLEECYSASDTSYPISCNSVQGYKHKIDGLLNTSLVLGYSFNSKINTTNKYNKTNQSYYGVGGIAGLLATTIDDSDYIQSESTKKDYLEIICRGTNKTLTLNSLKDISIDDLRALIDATQFVTDGTGGIAGMGLGAGNVNVGLNLEESSVKFNSHIDAIVFGRNRVGGAVGDTVAHATLGGHTAIANACPYKATSSSSGMCVLGYENVGGIVGTFGDNGGQGSYPGLNQKSQYDSVKGKVDCSFHVIGYRAVGGIIGTFARDNGSADRKKQTILINLRPSSGDISVRGEMYVGGAVGIQEGFLNSTAADTYRYCFENLYNFKVTAKAFAGAIAGAILSDTDYWPLDKMADVFRDKNGKAQSTIGKMVVTSDACAGLMTGIYATENMEGKNSVLWNTTVNGNQNYKRYGTDSFESQNGLYNISGIRNLKYKEDLAGFINDAKTVYNSASISVTDAPVIDLFTFCNTIQIGGNENTSTITAKIYVGGMAGFVSDYTPITVSKYRNRAKLYATDAIQSHEISASDTNWYSYLGIVTGKVPKGMTLDMCVNSSSCYNNYQASSKTSYVGGIAEINAGVIKRYGYTSDGKTLDYNGRFMSNDNTYVKNTNNTSGSAGAIVGLNGTKDTNGTTEGVIQNCANVDPVKGTTKAAGIAAAAGGNSLIKGCVNYADIRSSRNDSQGGAAGILFETADGVPASARIQVIDCANTGILYATSENSEYAAGITYDTKGLGELKLCRNYATKQKYAINKGAVKSIQYCLDASDASENTDDKYTGFGIDPDNPNNKANLYIGRKASEPTLGTPEETDLFIADQLYTADHQIYKPDGWSWDGLWAPIKTYNEVTKRTDIDDLVLSSTAGGDLDHKEASVWAIESSNPAGRLSFEIQAVDEYGRPGNSFADIDSFSIFWDNYAKTQINKYYGAASTLKSNDKLSDSDYQEFIGANDTSGKVFQSIMNIARDECLNETNRPSGYASGTLTNNIWDLANGYYWADMYGLTVYMYMVDNNTDYADWNSQKKKDTYIGLLYSLIGTHPLNGVNSDDAFYSKIKTTFNNNYSDLTPSPYYAGFAAALDKTYIDYALDILNYGSSYEETQYGDRYYTGTKSDYPNWARQWYAMTRESFIAYDVGNNADANVKAQIRKVYDYMYATYIDMLSRKDVPSSEAARYAYYQKLLADNAQDYGPTRLSNGQWTFEIKYNLVFTDVNGKKLSVGQIQTNISQSEFYKEQKIDIDGFKNASWTQYGDGYFAQRDMGQQDANKNIWSYKDADFNYDKISSIVVIMTNEYATVNDGRLGIRALSWETNGNEATSMKRPDKTKKDPYRSATSRDNVLKTMDDYGIPLTALYFDKASTRAPELYLYKYSTNIYNIVVEKTVTVDGQSVVRTLVNDEDPQYFSSTYTSESDGIGTTVNVLNSRMRNKFYQQIDAKYRNMMSVIYQP